MDDVQNVLAQCLADAQAKVGTLLHAEVVGAVRAFCTRLDQVRDDAAARQRLVREQPATATLREAFTSLVATRMGAFSAKVAVRLTERIDEDLCGAVLARLAAAFPALFDPVLGGGSDTLAALQAQPPLPLDAPPAHAVAAPLAGAAAVEPAAVSVPQPGPPPPAASPAGTRGRSRSRERGGAPVAPSDVQQQQQRSRASVASSTRTSATRDSVTRATSTAPPPPDAPARPSIVSAGAAAAQQYYHHPPPLPLQAQLQPPPPASGEPPSAPPPLQAPPLPPLPPASFLEPLRTTSRRARSALASDGGSSSSSSGGGGSASASPPPPTALLPSPPWQPGTLLHAPPPPTRAGGLPTTVRTQPPREVTLGVQSSEILCAYYAAGTRHSVECRFDHMAFDFVHWHSVISPSSARVARRFETSPPLFQVSTDHGPRYVDAAHSRLIDVPEVRDCVQSFLCTNRHAFNGALELSGCPERIDEQGQVIKPFSPPTATVKVAAGGRHAAAAAAAAATAGVPQQASGDVGTHSRHEASPDGRLRGASAGRGEGARGALMTGAAAIVASTGGDLAGHRADAGGGAVSDTGGQPQLQLSAAGRGGGDDSSSDSDRPKGGLQQLCINHAQNELKCRKACNLRHVSAEAAGTASVVGHVVNTEHVADDRGTRSWATYPLLLVLRFPRHTREPGCLAPPSYSIVHRILADPDGIHDYCARHRTRINQDLYACGIRLRVCHEDRGGRLRGKAPLEEY